jgi:molybdate transport system substrate-binding protein
MIRLAVAAAAWFVVTAAVPVNAEELTVSVAISLKDVVRDLGRAFAARRPDAQLRYNVGGSGELAHQIAGGAPVDVFVSAGERQMDALSRAGLLLPDTRHVLARNALVVIVSADSRLALRDPADLSAPRVGRIALGNPRTVPAGEYAERSLRALGLWEPLRPRLVFAENVRQVLEYVGRGEVGAGFVYGTDVAAGRGRVSEAFRIAPEVSGVVVYAMAVIAGARHAATARAFVDWLTGPEAQAVLMRHGFLPAPPVANP